MTREEIDLVLKRLNVYRDSIMPGPDGKIIYRIFIPEMAQYIYRYKTVQTEDELIEFIRLLNNSDRIIPDNYEDIEPNVSFFKDGKKLSIDIVDKQEADEKEHVRKNFYKQAVLESNLNDALNNALYHSPSAKINELIEQNNDLRQRIDELKDNFNNKFAFLFSKTPNELPEKDITYDSLPKREPIDSNLSKEEYKNITGKMSSSNNELIHTFFNDLSYILQRDNEYNELLKEHNVLQRQYTYLKGLTTLPLKNKIFISNTQIDKELEKIENSSTKETINSEEVKEVATEFKKVFNSLSKDRQIELLNDFSKIYSFSEKKELLKKYKEISIMDTKSTKSGPVKTKETSQRKMERIMSDLEKQFEKNLTDEQKKTIDLYNSSLYLLINEITRIDGYEKLTDEELLSIIQSSNLYSKIQTIIIKKKLDVEGKDDELSMFFKNILGNGLLDTIHNTRKYIDILKSIPPSSVVLPEDITVYRGIFNKDKEDLDEPNLGLFMSTSMDSSVAKDVTRGEGFTKIIKIDLKAGTPVIVFPYTIQYNPTTKKLFKFKDSEKIVPVREILLNMSHFTHPTMKKTKINKFLICDGVLIQSEPGYLFECDMKVREDVKTKIKSDERLI